MREAASENDRWRIILAANSDTLDTILVGSGLSIVGEEDMMKGLILAFVIAFTAAITIVWVAATWGLVAAILVYIAILAGLLSISILAG